MTRENLEIGKKLIEKIEAAERLLLWCAKGFNENTGVRGLQQVGDNSANEIRKDLILLMPEIEEHFKQIKFGYEKDFDLLK